MKILFFCGVLLSFQIPPAFLQTDQVHFFSFSSSVTIYIDGVKTRPDRWFREGLCSLTLTEKPSHLVAVRLSPPKHSHGQSSHDRPHGFILSISQHIATQEYSSTDGTWKCARNLKNYPKSAGDLHPWFDGEYSDQDWSAADVLGKNGDQPWGAVEGIAGHASWITVNNNAKGDMVYCRGTLSSKPDMLTIASAAYMRIFGDGRYLGDGKTRLKQPPLHFRLPGGISHVIAVHAKLNSGHENQSWRGAIIASLRMALPYGGHSNGEWRCKASLSAEEETSNHWAGLKIHDQTWPPARVLGNHGDDPWGSVLDISSQSTWIWAEKVEAEEVFCRSRWFSSSENDGEFQAGSSHSIPHAGNNQLDFNPLPIYPTRPPVTSVPEITATNGSFTWELFFKSFLLPGRPFKLKGGVSHWPAIAKWTDAYLNNIIGDESTEVLLAPENSERYYFYSKRKRRVEMKVSQFLQTYRDPSRRADMYLIAHGLTEDGTITSPLLHDFEVPSWAKNLDLTEDGANLWMGLGPQITPAHFDNVENFMCVVSGRKRFRLYEPSMTNYLYPETHDRITSITSRIEDLSNPDLKKFPEAVNLKPVFVDLEAGDLLFIPAYWWHEVTSYDRNVAVNMWFKSHSTLLDSIHTAWCERLPQSQWGREQEQKRASKQNQHLASEEREDDERTFTGYENFDTEPVLSNHNEL